MRQLDMGLLGEIKRLAVLAMISDDDLMEMFIFKGGSAIEMIYDVTSRASLDLDFSMEAGLTEAEEDEVAEKVIITLEGTFKEAGYLAYDIQFGRRPHKVSEEVKDFWGGYEIKFKVIPLKDAEQHQGDIGAIRRNSLPVGKRGSTIFKIDISSYEYCTSRQAQDFEDYTIYVYSPEMIVFEKLRAICQQMPEYENFVKTMTRKARGRDFYDIYLLMEQFRIDPGTPENLELIRNIFGIKRVPLEYIYQIRNYREFHRENFETSLKDTVVRDEDLQPFDYYFDFLLDQFESLPY